MLEQVALRHDTTARKIKAVVIEVWPHGLVTRETSVSWVRLRAPKHKTENASGKAASAAEVFRLCVAGVVPASGAASEGGRERTGRGVVEPLGAEGGTTERVVD